MITRDELEIFQAGAPELVAEVFADYTALTGRVVLAGQPEAYILLLMAYREFLLRQQANEAVRQNLVAFATAPLLDFLGQLVGVSRLPASGALATLQFTTTPGKPSAVVVPSGTRVASVDSQFVYETMADLTIAAAQVSGTVEAVCLTPGESGNGRQPTVILDPVPYVSAAGTLTPPAGGTSEETDEALRQRITLAPNSFSVAGPAKAYVFFAKSASPTIIDVAVTNPLPGVVQLYPLVKSGPTPPETLAAVLQTCSPDDVRPICDTVLVTAPTVVPFALQVELVLYSGQSATGVQSEVEKALMVYAADRRAGLGRDIITAQIIGTIMAGDSGRIYAPTVLSPAASIVVALNEVAECTGVSVTVTGFNNG